MNLIFLTSRARFRHIQMDGDSITAGGTYVPADTAGVQLMTLLPPGCTHTNVAAGGSTSFAAPHSDFGQGVWTNVIHYEAAGVNDINAAIHTPEEIHTQLSLVTSLARAAGCFATVAATPILFADELASGPKTTAGAALRALIRADKCGADVLVDYAADPFFQNPANYGPEAADGTGDGATHPGTLGTLRMMQMLATAIINGGLL